MENNTTNNTLLSVKDLFVQYTSDGKVIKAVNGVSFTLEKGKTLGIVGETGAGKTTIAKSILRILPDISASITAGEIIFEGVDLLQIQEKEMRKIRGNKIAMIFQDPMTALNPVFTIGAQIQEAILLHSVCTKAEAYERTIKILEKVGIPGERYDDYPHQFSGGMKQRIVIAMALVCNPEIVLADEPTTALDVTIQAQVLDMITKQRKELGTAMILITHDLGVVAEVCDDVAVVYAGEVIEMAEKIDLFDHPSHPYTVGLFGSIPSLTNDVERLSPIAGMPPDPSNLQPGCNFAPRCPYRTEECMGDIPFVEVYPGHFCRCVHGKERRTN